MILLQLTGVTGDSATDGHIGWINVNSLQLGVGRGITSASGTDRDPSQPSFSEITFTKSTDICSTELFAQAIYGEALGEKAVVHLLQTGGKDKTQQVYLELELFNPIISAYSASSGGDRPSESISINYTKIGYKYKQFKEGSTPVKADPKGYDITTGKIYVPPAMAD